MNTSRRCVFFAQAELLANGIELVGDVERDTNWEWLTFRAPDENLYALAVRRRASTAGPGP